MSEISLKNPISTTGISPKVGTESIKERQFDKTLGSDFSKALEEKLKAGLGQATLTSASPLKFSNHAVDRMQTRGIRFSEEQLTRINDAVQKAAQKGAKETLVLTDESALIVSVKNNTVVTVMDKMMLKENVFTNIDSAVVL